MLKCAGLNDLFAFWYHSKAESCRLFWWWLGVFFYVRLTLFFCFILSFSLVYSLKKCVVARRVDGWYLKIAFKSYIHEIDDIFRLSKLSDNRRYATILFIFVLQISIFPIVIVWTKLICLGSFNFSFSIARRRLLFFIHSSSYENNDEINRLSADECIILILKIIAKKRAPVYPCKFAILWYWTENKIK